jgi:hypothetical protein
MSSATVEAWTACISDLEQLLQLIEDDAAPDADFINPVSAIAIGVCQQRLAQLKQQPTLTPAEFRELVQDVQVWLAVSAFWGGGGGGAVSQCVLAVGRWAHEELTLVVLSMMPMA